MVALAHSFVGGFLTDVWMVISLIHAQLLARVTQFWHREEFVEPVDNGYVLRPGVSQAQVWEAFQTAFPHSSSDGCGRGEKTKVRMRCRLLASVVSWSVFLSHPAVTCLSKCCGSVVRLGARHFSTVVLLTLCSADKANDNDRVPLLEVQMACSRRCNFDDLWSPRMPAVQC